MFSKEQLSKLSSFLPILFITLFFYFFVIRPNNKRRKEVNDMLASLKIGDKIITHSGVFGNIKGMPIDSNKISIEISKNVCIDILKNSILRVEEPTQQKGSTDILDHSRKEEHKKANSKKIHPKNSKKTSAKGINKSQDDKATNAK